MILLLITNDPKLAQHAVSSGVDRLFVDLEVRGKQERQRHLDSHRALHTVQDVQALRQVVPKGALLARINPLYANSAEEIDAVVEAGADYIMLPMFTSPEDVAAFLGLVRGRARSSLLLETPQALARIDDILASEGHIDEIHVGLNDLHLGLGLDFMFELLSGGLIEYIAKKVQARGIRFGFGGIARVGQGAVPAELIVGEHVRLGSEMVILSRTFHGRAGSLLELQGRLDLRKEVAKVRACEAHFRTAGRERLETNRTQLNEAVRHVVETRSLPGHPIPA